MATTRSLRTRGNHTISSGVKDVVGSGVEIGMGGVLCQGSQFTRSYFWFDRSDVIHLLRALLVLARRASHGVGGIFMGMGVEGKR